MIPKQLKYEIYECLNVGKWIGIILIVFFGMLCVRSVFKHFYKKKNSVVEPITNEKKNNWFID